MRKGVCVVITVVLHGRRDATGRQNDVHGFTVFDEPIGDSSVAIPAAVPVCLTPIAPIPFDTAITSRRLSQCCTSPAADIPVLTAWSTSRFSACDKRNQLSVPELRLKTFVWMVGQK